jgi:hypothetical protein
MRANAEYEGIIFIAVLPGIGDRQPRLTGGIGSTAGMQGATVAGRPNSGRSG